MYFKGFKLALTLTFLILILLGMLVLNGVIFFFWKHQTISTAVEEAHNYMNFFNFIEESSVLSCQNLYDHGFKLVRAGHNSSMEFVLYCNGLFLSQNTVDDSVRDSIIRSLENKKVFVQSIGRQIGFFGIFEESIIVAQPFLSNNNSSGGAVIIDGEILFKQLHNYKIIVLLYILVNTIILTSIWFFRIRKMIMVPLEKLVDLAEISVGLTPDMLQYNTGKNEFGQLADALKGMIARIEEDRRKLTETIASLERANKQIIDNQTKLVETEKFAAVGRLSAGLAHEIGNPLGIVNGYLELLGSGEIEKEDRDQYTRRAQKEIDRIAVLVQRLLDYSRKKEEQKGRTDLIPVIYELVEMVKSQKGVENIEFTVITEEFFEKCLCSESGVHQVLLNCILNSIDAIKSSQREAGHISLHLSKVEEASNKTARIVIEDDGVGITSENLSLVFDPFFTTKEVGKGTGLGLSVSRTIVENCGGTISINPKNSCGTVVEINFAIES